MKIKGKLKKFADDILLPVFGGFIVIGGTGLLIATEDDPLPMNDSTRYYLCVVSIVLMLSGIILGITLVALGAGEEEK